jgi:hypothetical protein
MKIRHLQLASGSALSLPGLSLAAFSSRWILSSHPLMCSALILVAPAAHPFFNPLATACNSESVGMLSEISKCRKLCGRATPIGGALAYNFTCLVVCLTMVSGHVGGGWSSTNLYHPLRVHHASFMALLLRGLLTVDAAFVTHCLQSAASRDLISCPIRWAIAVVRWPCLRILVRLSTAAQVLSDIHQLVGRSLTGGGDYVKT